MSFLFEYSMFNGDISNWDVSNVTNMCGMLTSSENFNSPIGNWDVSNVTSMMMMFSGAKKFNKDISSWNVSNVINMSNMFSYSQFNKDIGNWDTSNVIDISCMFYKAKNFNQDIGNWDVSNVTNMLFTFSDTPQFNKPLNNWNTSKVTNMNNMFSNSKFNKPLNFNTSKVAYMESMFYGAKNFNQDILHWDFSSINSLNSLNFLDKIKLDKHQKEKILNKMLYSINLFLTKMSIIYKHRNNIKNLNNKLEGKIPVTREDLIVLINSWGRDYTFSSFSIELKIYKCKATKCYDLSKLDTSEINDMSYIFVYSNFNGDISKWNLKSIKDLSNIFILADNLKEKYLKVFEDKINFNLSE